VTRSFVKTLVDRTTGYWIYKTRHLPIGTDLRLDVTKRLRCGKIRTLFDVGANFGQSYKTFRQYFPDARIYCFEPVTETFSILQRTVVSDSAARAEQLAFGATPGTQNIRLFRNAPGWNSLREDLMSHEQGAREEVVRVDTIDNYCLRNGILNIDLLKIDTEGFEIPVIQGAHEMLTKGRVSLILAEVGFDSRNRRNSPFSELVEQLLSVDYRFFGVYDVTHDHAFRVAFGNALFAREGVLYPKPLR